MTKDDFKNIRPAPQEAAGVSPWCGVHQLLPGFASGDAISNEAIQIQDIIRSWGCNSKIFTVTRHTSSKVRHLCYDYSEYKGDPQNVLIYHHSIGSSVAQFFKNLPDKKVIIYHNITPDMYFRTINSEKALALFQGREQLKELSTVPCLALADSKYNRQELLNIGFKSTDVLPIIMNFKTLAENPKKKMLNRYNDNFINLLFVGRITPNKKIEDVIKVFYYFRQTVSISARLFIAGSYVGMEKYYAFLRAMILELNLPNVIFTGHVTNEELFAYYKLADVFVCMSEHEGFCVPLVESMYFGIPIVAYRAAAVPDTLGGSGVLIDTKDYPVVAELIGRIVSDINIKNKIIEGQNNRLKDFSREKLGEKFHSILYDFNFS